MKIFGYYLIDIINPVKWFRVLEGLIMKRYIKWHIVEQLAIRFVECRSCLDAGKCYKCGCDAAAKMLIMEETCSDNKWGSLFKDESEWREIKDKYKIDIHVSRGMRQYSLTQEKINNGIS
jgi:hypothetical protein